MARDSNRDVRNSVRSRIADLFVNPPTASGLAAYVVYGEADLRLAQAGQLVGRTFPSLFLIDAAIKPVRTALPMIVMDIVIHRAPFQLGSDRGMAFDCSVHCFGRQSNEASLLSSHIADNLRPLPIYDYADPDTPVFRETASLDLLIDQVRGPVLSDAERKEGDFDFWFITTFRGSIRDVY